MASNTNSSKFVTYLGWFGAAVIVAVFAYIAF
ncbi:hypothetical protein hairong_169 [Pseudomonas phage hairong]|nr:hypothetical protein hairong_169 [Pseudomonas phage hairong]